MRRMITNMTHNETLIVNAMLASYVCEKHMSYINLLEPFVINALPTKKYSLINVDDIAKIIKSEFGFENIKIKVIEKILLNLSKNNNPNKCVKHEKNKNTYHFYVEHIIDTTDFNNRKIEMTSLVNDVVLHLRDFINNNSILKSVDLQESKKILIDFLNMYNAISYDNIQKIEEIKNEEKIFSFNYKVAQFIIQEYNSELGCFQKIKKIQEGYFASIALYHFCNNDINEDDEKILSNTDVILDTMLLIDSLHLDTEYKAKSMDELLDLIVNNGGSLYTFDYYVSELEDIIDTYVKNSSSRISLNLDKFRREKTEKTKIAYLLYKIKEDAEKHKKIILPAKKYDIKVISSSFHDELIQNQSWHIDLEKLEKLVLEKIPYKYGEQDRGFVNDISSIEQTIFDADYKNKRTLFISSNHNLMFVADKFTEKKLFYTDIDLTSMIWLSNYNPKSKLSEFILLQNAYAAIAPTKEIMDTAIKIIEKNIDSTDENLKEEAKFLRYNPDLLYYISKTTENNKDNIDENLQSKIMNSLKKDIKQETKKEVELEYENDYEKLNAEKALLKKQKDEFQIYKEDIISQKNDLDKQKQMIEEFKKSKRDKYKIVSKVISNCLTMLFSLVFIVAVFLVVYVIIYMGISNLKIGKSINNIYQIATIISSVATFGAFLFKGIDIFKKLNKKFVEYFYDLLCKHSIVLNLDKNKKT